MQGLALELIGTIRAYREARRKKKKMTAIFQSSGDKYKELGDALENKGRELQAEAKRLTGGGKAAEARPLLLQARVFYKAAANLEKSFTAHKLSISVLEEMGNYEQARAEYRELLEQDLVNVENAVLIANGKKPKRKGSLTEAADDDDEGLLLKAQLTAIERSEVEVRPCLVGTTSWAPLHSSICHFAMRVCLSPCADPQINTQSRRPVQRASTPFWWTCIARRKSFPSRSQAQVCPARECGRKRRRCFRARSS